MSNFTASTLLPFRYNEHLRYGELAVLISTCKI